MFNFRLEIPSLVLTTFMLGFCSMATMAYGYYASDMVTEQRNGDVMFITGGIGEEETLAIKNSGARYNVHILNSGKDGSFIRERLITITNAKGKTLLMEEAGPLFYVQLPSGKYQIMVESPNGPMQKKTVNVSKTGVSTIHFLWK